MNPDGVVRYLNHSRDVVQAAIDDPQFSRIVIDIAERTARTLVAGGKVLLAGNGGSASDAQHIAGELVSRMNYDRAPLPAIALTPDSSVMTAIANDYGYERVFARQIAGLGRPGDIFFAISTSGRSPNILAAIEAARRQGLTVIGLTGRSGGGMPAICDVCLRVPADETPLIQQLHIVVGHLVCTLVEEKLFPHGG
jgi:D-sedoheptulose 7-phosphate isomerase